MSEIQTTTIDEQTDWCPTCGQRTAPWVEVYVGPVELRAILEATERAPAAGPGARRILAFENNAFVRSGVTFACGHAYCLKEMWAEFYNAPDGLERLEPDTTRSDLGSVTCPTCLLGEIERGEAVVVNPEEIELVLKQWKDGSAL
jgi:hypothetical protein